MWLQWEYFVFSSNRGILQSQAEVNYLGQLYHPNLVKLIGYCLEDEHRLLVYEFMPRGSLENHLFRSEFFVTCSLAFISYHRGSYFSRALMYLWLHDFLFACLLFGNAGGSYFQPLSWNLRMKVSLGAARGLAFLHSAETKVIYRDFKTSNILLDSVCDILHSFRSGFWNSSIWLTVFSLQNYNAKLSDFGLAKDGPTGDKSHVSTRVMGTYGYAAPEYLATGTNHKSFFFIFSAFLADICQHWQQVSILHY